MRLQPDLVLGSCSRAGPPQGGLLRILQSRSSPVFAGSKLSCLEWPSPVHPDFSPNSTHPSSALLHPLPTGRWELFTYTGCVSLLCSGSPSPRAFPFLSIACSSQGQHPSQRVPSPGSLSRLAKGHPTAQPLLPLQIPEDCGLAEARGCS